MSTVECAYSLFVNLRRSQPTPLQRLAVPQFRVLSSLVDGQRHAAFGILSLCEPIQSPRVRFEAEVPPFIPLKTSSGVSERNGLKGCYGPTLEVFR